MISFNFKNTYFFWVFISVFGFISCSDKSSNKTSHKNTEVSQNLTHDSLSYTNVNNSLITSYPENYLHLIKDKVVGVVGNQTSIVKNKNNDFTHLIDTLVSLKINIKKVFSPEHGFRGKADAGEKI
ncbi:MAG TPA: DUF1343 domain-containing protein, partial [Flavobacteriaceae bacterium]|nr:DUF1343 domain-containing protein [Flavobacteriaceae bacterium]